MCSSYKKKEAVGIREKLKSDRKFSKQQTKSHHGSVVKVKEVCNYFSLVGIKFSQTLSLKSLNLDWVISEPLVDSKSELVEL